MTDIQLKEADVKRAIADWLAYQQNAGRLLYFRLNAGSFILTDKEGNFRRRVQGVRRGTADFLVIEKSQLISYPGIHNIQEIIYPLPKVTFLECKNAIGKQSRAQVEFEKQAKEMNCRYFVIRSVDEAIEVLK